MNFLTLLASGSYGVTIRVWNALQRTLLATFIVHTGLVIRFWDLEKIVAIGKALAVYKNSQLYNFLLF